MTAIGERITQAREALGLTQAQLAQRMPCTAQTISNWETARRQPRHADLVRLSEVTGRPVSWFLGEDETPATLSAVRTAFERIQDELLTVRALLDRTPPAEGTVLAPVAGTVAGGATAVLTPGAAGWRRLAADQAAGVRLWVVAPPGCPPGLEPGDLLGIEPATAAVVGRWVTVSIAASERVARVVATDRLESWAGEALPAAPVTGLVRWLDRSWSVGRDALAEAAERLAWVSDADDEIGRLEQQLERGEGQWSELVELGDRLVEAAEQLRGVYGARALEPAARALARAARALGELGHYPAALVAARRAETCFAALEEVGERSRDALNNLYNLSQLALFQGEIDAAATAAERAADCSDWRVRWKALKNLAEINVNFRAGVFDASLCADILSLAEAHAAEEPVEARLARAVAYEIRGNAAFGHGLLPAARAEAAAELAQAEAAGLPYRIANALLNVAQYAGVDGDAAAALAAVARAGELTAAQELGDLEALRRAHLAAAEAVHGDLTTARVAMHQAWRLAAALDSPRARLATELAGLQIARVAGDLTALEDHAAAAREQARAMGLAPYEAVIERLTGRADDGS